MERLGDAYVGSVAHRGGLVRKVATTLFLSIHVGRWSLLASEGFVSVSVVVLLTTVRRNYDEVEGFFCLLI